MVPLNLSRQSVILSSCLFSETAIFTESAIFTIAWQAIGLSIYAAGHLFRPSMGTYSFPERRCSTWLSIIVPCGRLECSLETETEDS